MREIILLLLAALAAPTAVMAAAEPPERNQGAKPVREIKEQGYRVQLDLSSQVLRLEVPEDRGYGTSMSAVPEEAPIAPTLAGIADEQFISAAVLAQKAKQFDDGLYAAVELAAQQGVGRFLGKAALLAHLCHSLTQAPAAPPSPAVITVLAAATLGNRETALPTAARKPVQEAIDAFRHDDLRSKPIGFYIWNDRLAAIFQQDRMLQTELQDQPGLMAIVKALHGNREVLTGYEAYLSLVARLTNPLSPDYPDLRGLLAAADRGTLVRPEQGFYFFPPSRAHETDLVKKLYGARPIPEGFSLVDEMIARIQDNRLTLHPTDESGWYDYQTWALEPLVIPDRMLEASRLELDASYRKQLLELFRGILALTRETHIKQLELPLAGAARMPQVIIRIVPELSAEPLATYFFRRAQSYAFIRQVLENSFGANALMKMQRLTASGPVLSPLSEELLMMENLFYGAYVTVCRELGMHPTAAPYPGPGKGTDTAAAALAAWRKKLADDPDVGRDARMMVPLFYDVNRKQTKVWVVMGWATRPVVVSFAAKPTTTVFDPKGRQVADSSSLLRFESSRLNLAYPVSAEVYVTKLLNRDEFREHCDRYRTRSAILDHLK